MSGRGRVDRLRASALAAARAGSTRLVGVGMSVNSANSCISQAARHRYVNRPKSIWEASDMLASACACFGGCFCHAEILMMDVENNGRPPCRRAVSVMC